MLNLLNNICVSGCRAIEMVRGTQILRQVGSSSHPVSHATQKSPLVYSLGLSYASKASPPFVPPRSQPQGYGFAGQNHRLGKWVDEMMRLRAGRGELQGEKEGGWEEDLDQRRIKWGAGEDFFGVCEGGGYVSGLCPFSTPASTARVDSLCPLL